MSESYVMPGRFQAELDQPATARSLSAKAVHSTKRWPRLGEAPGTSNREIPHVRRNPAQACRPKKCPRTLRQPEISPRVRAR